MTREFVWVAVALGFAVFLGWNVRGALDHAEIRKLLESVADAKHRAAKAEDAARHAADLARAERPPVRCFCECPGGER
jgi:heme exporter protein D